MTLIDFTRDRRHGVALTIGTITDAIVHASARLNAIREQRRTERALEAMPSDLRKDIGWPASDMGRNDRRRTITIATSRS